MRHVIRVLVIGTALACSSCSWFSSGSSDKAPAPVAPSFNYEPITELPKTERMKAAEEAYKKDDITLDIKADPVLNRYQNNAHTLFLCIYQLKDPNAFNQMVEEEGGISKLMDCRRFDASVANAKRLVVQPGQELKDSRDRAQGARYVGIAAGYFGTGKEKVTHLELLPPGNSNESSGTLIRIELGPLEIDSVKVQ